MVHPVLGTEQGVELRSEWIRYVGRVGSPTAVAVADICCCSMKVLAERNRRSVVGGDTKSLEQDLAEEWGCHSMTGQGIPMAVLVEYKREASAGDMTGYLMTVTASMCPEE